MPPTLPFPLAPAVRFLLGTGLLLGGVWSGDAVGNTDLPDIGDPAGTVYSPEHDRHLGRAFLRQLHRSAPLVSDQELHIYIQSLGERIALHSDAPERKFTFVVLFGNDINAFAGPGGVIGINTGVLLNSKNESELAAVLAHEIAHITQHHLARAFEHSSKYQLPLAAAMLGAVLLGTGARNPDLGVATAAAVQGLGVQGRLNFTRANEREADRVGMQFLVRAGFAPSGMPDFFRRLLHKHRYQQSNIPEYLRTHPLTVSRIADSEARAEQKTTVTPANSLEYELMHAKVQAYSTKNAIDAVRLYASRLRKPAGDNLREESLRYGYAMALMRNNEFASARQQADQLLAGNDQNVWYLTLAANIALAAQNYDRALALFEKAHRLHPESRAVLFAWCRGLLDAEQPHEARRLLRNWRQHNDYRNNVEFFDLLSQAEAQSGHKAEGTIAKGELFYLLGDTDLAIDQLKFAENKLALNDYLQQRVNARRIEWEAEVALEKRLKIRN